jgi:hypothetical protein
MTIDKIKKIVFYTMGHNGDVHYSREFVKDLMKELPGFDYEYRHNCSPKLLKDITNLHIKPFDLHHIYNNQMAYEEANSTLYINTWIGAENCKYIPGEIGCSLNANYNKYKDIYEILKIKLKDIEYYIPEIEWGIFNTENIDDFFDDTKQYCLISNGNVLSGQSNNFNFDPIVEKLADMCSNVNFILTNNSNKILKNNIYYTNDIIRAEENDLNEIGYIATKCKLIVGRASGPFCFCHNKKVLLENQKTLIVFCNLKNDGIWAETENILNGGAKQLWSNNFDFDNICDIIKKSIEEA